MRNLVSEEDSFQYKIILILIQKCETTTDDNLVNTENVRFAWFVALL